MTRLVILQGNPVSDQPILSQAPQERGQPAQLLVGVDGRGTENQVAGSKVAHHPTAPYDAPHRLMAQDPRERPAVELSFYDTFVRATQTAAKRLGQRLVRTDRRRRDLTNGQLIRGFHDDGLHMLATAYLIGDRWPDTTASLMARATARARRPSSPEATGTPSPPIAFTKALIPRR